MERKNNTFNAHCIVLAVPGQGHINPALQFSKRLQHKGVKVTFVSTRFIINTIMRNSSSSSLSASNISVETFSDGFDEGGVDLAGNFEDYSARSLEVGSKTLTSLIERLNASSGLPVNSIVYDSNYYWCLDIARKFGMVAAAFCTQTCAVYSLYYHVYKGTLKLPVPNNTQVLLPGIPPLEPQDLPSFMYDLISYPSFLPALLQQFSNIHSADWVLFNTIYELEPELIDWIANMWPLKIIGPTVPSKYVDQRLHDDIDYDLNLFKSNNGICNNWLEDKPKGSVVYVSFGSMASLNTEQTAELSWGLKRSGCYFLWVLRETEEEKLPKDFIEGTKDKGLVVSWCSQLEVLSHEAVGCFVTHCGWNSILEALSLGVPIVAMPQWTDQNTNAKYINDVWKVGLKPLINEEGIIRQESIEECIRKIMEGDKGKEIKENARKWKVLMKKAMEVGGRSDQAINEFVTSITNHKT